MSADDQSGGGSAAYAAFIKDEVDAQEARKDSVEKRGLAVVTTSGTLVTLLFGLTALATKRHATYQLPLSSEILLGFALGLFFAATLTALATNVPVPYGSVAVEGLEDAVDNRWGDTTSEAERVIAITRINNLRVAKRQNELKGRILIWAVAFEVGAVALVASAVGFVLVD